MLSPLSLPSVTFNQGVGGDEATSESVPTASVLDPTVRDELRAWAWTQGRKDARTQGWVAAWTHGRVAART